MGRFTNKFRTVKREVLQVAGDTLTVSGLRGLKHFQISARLINSGSILPNLRFNGDSGANYADRLAVNGAADATAASATQIRLSVAAIAQDFFVWGVVLAPSENEKLVILHSEDHGGADATTTPNRREVVGKWENVIDGVDSISLVNTDTGDFAAGSELIVLGHD